MLINSFLPNQWFTDLPYSLYVQIKLHTREKQMTKKKYVYLTQISKYNLVLLIFKLVHTSILMCGEDGWSYLWIKHIFFFKLKQVYSL